MATPATATPPSVSNGQSAPKPLAPPTAAGLVPISLYKHYLSFLNLIQWKYPIYSQIGNYKSDRANFDVAGR